MALASALHHSADKTTRAQHNAPRGQKNTGTEYHELSDDDVVPARGSWPPCLGEPRGPQDKDQSRTVEQTADYAPVVQILGAPVPQMVDQLVAILSHVDSLVSEQVIAAPKISWPSRFPRTVLREPQKAEQLVEVPTIVSLVQVIEQTVDIPVGAGGGSGNGGHQGFLPGQGFQPTLVPIAESLTIPVPPPFGLRGLQGLHPDPSSAAISSQPAGDAFQVFFRTLRRRKKSAKVTWQEGARVVADSSSSMPASHDNEWWEDADGNMWLKMPSGRWMSERAGEYIYWEER